MTRWRIGLGQQGRERPAERLSLVSGRYHGIDSRSANWTRGSPLRLLAQRQRTWPPPLHIEHQANPEEEDNDHDDDIDCDCPETDPPESGRGGGRKKPPKKKG